VFCVVCTLCRKRNWAHSMQEASHSIAALYLAHVCSFAASLTSSINSVQHAAAPAIAYGSQGPTRACNAGKDAAPAAAAGAATAAAAALTASLLRCCRGRNCPVWSALLYCRSDSSTWWLALLRISPIGFCALLLLQLHLPRTPRERACKAAII
jgi:hypothetical protein